MSPILQGLIAFAAAAVVTVAVTPSARPLPIQLPPGHELLVPRDAPTDYVIRADVVSNDVGGYVQSDDRYKSIEACLAYAESDTFAGVLTRLLASMRQQFGPDLRFQNLRCEVIGQGI